MYQSILSRRFMGVLMSVSVLAATAQAQLPAFPGADGAAAYVTGGRTGVVYHVTLLDKNFNDVRPGTLRYGLDNANFPGTQVRTIVFDVAGVFWLGRYGAESNHNNGWDTLSRYNFPANVTIAGQTAPGPVILMGGSTKAGNANMIIRNITIAAGYGMRSFHDPSNPSSPTPGDFPDSYVYDAIDISGNNIIIDHVSAFFTTDESISCNELGFNLTVQNCNISQGQNYPQADAESSGVSYTGHALAQLWQPGTGAKSSILNNLFAHQAGRLPRVGSEVGTGAFNDFRNNVYYNWAGTAGGGGGSQPSFNNFINNFYLAGYGGDGPVGGANSNIVHFNGGTGIFSGGSTTKTYLLGNLRDTDKNGSPNNTSSADASYGSTAKAPVAYDINIGATLSAKDAFTNVLRHVGARWWERTYDFRNNSGAISSIDERLIKETITGSGQIIAWADDPFNLTTNALDGQDWTNLLALRADVVTGAAPFNRPAGWDTDLDGMPNQWELEHGLDPNVADNNGDFDNDGYSNLEEYLNEVAAWPAADNVYFNGTNTSRFAEIFNWQINGQNITITNMGLGTTNTYTSSTKWQPSKYDTAVISNSTVLVDSIGQHAGTLRLAPAAGNNATLDITNGWLKVANTLEIAKAGTGTVNLSGGKLRVGTLTNGGGTASFNLTGGTLAADVVTFNLVNSGGIISPGDSPGLTHVKADLTQTSGSMAIEVGGTNFGESDLVVVDGVASLNGALVVTFTNGYIPPLDSVYTILTCGSRVGNFTSFDYPTNVATLQLVYSSTNVQLVVSESTFNTTPTFNIPPTDRVVNVGVTVLATNLATDTDLPAQTLVYTLLSAPAGATFNTNNGDFAWRPTVNDANTTNFVSVSVSDQSIPPLGATQSFNITVNALTPTTIANPVRIGNQLVLTINGQAGPDYAFQTSTNLTNWSTLFITNSPAMPLVWTNVNIGTERMLFYRIKAGPPLP